MGGDFEPSRRYKTTEIAKAYGVTRRTVCDWINRDGLAARRLRKDWRILGKDLNKFLEKQ